MTNSPVRRLITAEVAIIQAALESSGRRGSGFTKHAYGTLDNKWHHGLTKEAASFKQYHCLPEKVQLNDIVITYRQRANPHRNRLGDFYMCYSRAWMEEWKNTCYASIIKFLLKITSGQSNLLHLDNEKQLAKWMLRYMRTGEFMTLATLQTLFSPAQRQDLQDLATIFYHTLVKEATSNVLPEDNTHELPLATAQARAIKLIAEGHLFLFNTQAFMGEF